MLEYPLVSVLMTSFNREKYIGKAIESVLSSSFEDFELIIVDDCSTDRTVEIARFYEAKDKRIKLFINEENLGDYPNRNKAASYANGRFIKYIDADDMIYPWGLAIIINNFEKFPDAGYCLDSIEQDAHNIFPMLLSPKDAYNREYFRSSIFNKSPTSATIRLEVFNRFGGFSGKRHIGDFELWHKLSLTENVLLLPHGIIWSREHEEQESKANRTDSYVLFKYMLVSKEFLKKEQNPLELSLKTKAIKRINRSISRSILRSVLIEGSLSKARLKRNASSMTLFQIIYFAFFSR
jgi:glycosyltransferase involved in cell wall biosynthesis